MYYSDFEPTNKHLVESKMFKGNRDYEVQQRVDRVVRVKPAPEKRISMSGIGYKEPSGKISYPLSSQKKIFGMTPKTLLVSLGIIVVSIWILSKTEANAGEVVNNGSVVV